MQQADRTAKAFGHVYWRGPKVWIKYYNHGRRTESVDKVTGKRGSTEADARALLLERANSIESAKAALRERLTLLREQIAAEQLAADWRTQGENEPNHEPIAPERLMFTDLERGILEDYKLHEYRSLDNLKNVRLKHLRQHFGSDRAIDITTPRLRQYTIARQREGAANESIHLELSALRRMFTIAVLDRSLSPAQAPHFPTVERGQPREVFLSAAEFVQILPRFNAENGRIIRWIWNTGWRISAACKLEWRDVNREEGWVILRRENSKNKHEQAIPLSPSLRAIIDEAYAERRLDQPCVFHHSDGLPFRRESVWRTFKKACTRAGIGIMLTTRKGKPFRTSNRTLHDMRRSAARDLIRSGITEDVARKITGHRTRNVFSRYNITTRDDIEHALAALEQCRAEWGRQPVRTISVLPTAVDGK